VCEVMYTSLQGLYMTKTTRLDSLETPRLMCLGSPNMA
jgi:hypothetical protein